MGGGLPIVKLDVSDVTYSTLFAGKTYLFSDEKSQELYNAASTSDLIIIEIANTKSIFTSTAFSDTEYILQGVAMCLDHGDASSFGSDLIVIDEGSQAILAEISMLTGEEAQTVYGIKTFEYLPQSSREPEIDTELVNKAYVDLRTDKNSAFRGKDITSYLTKSDFWKSIDNGTFDDIYIGDYFIKGGITYRVAGLDYNLNAAQDYMDGTHNVLIVPDTCMTLSAMHSTSGTAYMYTDLYTKVLPKLEKTVTDAFGSNHVLSYEDVLGAGVNSTAPNKCGGSTTLGLGATSSYSWSEYSQAGNKIKLNLMTELQVFGSTVCLLNALPNTFSSIIKEVNKKNLQYHTKTDGAPLITKDKIWLLSYPEVFGTTTYSQYLSGASPSNYEGEQYQYFVTSSNRIKYPNKNGEKGSADYYWLRSPSSHYDSSYGYRWCFVGSSGKADNYFGKAANGLAPAFCL